MKCPSNTANAALGAVVRPAHPHALPARYSIEDPPEYRTDLTPRISDDFAEKLKAFLRADPEVIILPVGDPDAAQRLCDEVESWGKPPLVTMHGVPPERLARVCALMAQAPIKPSSDEPNSFAEALTGLQRVDPTTPMGGELRDPNSPPVNLDQLPNEWAARE